MMKISYAKEIVEGAFKPHRCVAKDWDYGYLKFQVTTQDGKRWTVGDPGKGHTEKIRSEDLQSVRETIGLLRHELAARGYQLDEWSWPEE